MKYFLFFLLLLQCSPDEKEIKMEDTKKLFTLMSDHKAKEAIDYATTLEKKYPTDSFYPQTKAMVYWELNELDKANENFLRAVELNPKSSEVNTNIGLFYQIHNNCLKAIPYFEKAMDVEEVPYDFLTISYGLGYCHYKTKNYEKVLPYLVVYVQKAIEVKGDELKPQIKMAEEILEECTEKIQSKKKK
ncbi:MAG: hypothetical protein KBA66_07945 [Leptospiraceae bacterium]|nr:hypothetical protein [Leptospiraceae bacterium]